MLFEQCKIAQRKISNLEIHQTAIFNVLQLTVASSVR